MQKIPISGGPHTGKTTLLNALKAEYPEAHFVDEPAERVIARELAKEKASKTYKGLFPWDNYPRFARMAIDESLELEQLIPERAALSFQDRSLIDNIGYGKLNEFEDLVPEVERHIKLAGYAFALFCEPVGNYKTTLIRRETLQEAQRTHEHLSRAYENSGVDIIHLPAVAVEQRLAIICEVIDSV